ncbi:P-loop NTPase fold protein [uncultured Methanolobus sp.]|uniref:P-loop NTPase fold protein n=1 Tax=uncultured Methanolobus sp. TaxID=218300 RepID=UPI002AABF0EF|nr:P-loop NTPase fold protein [uncultured Methanolobus sp.]
MSDEISEDFKVAEDFDTAWSNFDPLFTLPANSPFHVERTGKPLNRLIRALLRNHRQPPKYYYSGHRGCGKSTELNILAEDENIKDKFFIVKYSVKDVCDVQNLNYVDVLFSVGAQLCIQYPNVDEKLKPELIDDLLNWQRGVIEQIDEKGMGIEASVEGGIKTVFASILGKIKAQESTRTVIRQTIEPRLSELIDKINMIIANIEINEGKKVLVLIDDLDKPNLEQAKQIFYTNQTAITQPLCYIVYTVPIAIFFSQEFLALRESCYCLPNIKLHGKNGRNEKDEAGYGLMKSFVHKRMKPDLIEDDALDFAIKIGGGLFRETARVMQIAIDVAYENERRAVQIEDV